MTKIHMTLIRHLCPICRLEKPKMRKLMGGASLREDNGYKTYMDFMTGEKILINLGC